MINYKDILNNENIKSMYKKIDEINPYVLVMMLDNTKVDKIMA